jgi:pimeloyl-ACP methyl ester carboxylesterase
MPSFLEVAGKKLEAELLGPRPPTLAFLHEGLGSLPQWRDFPARVAERTGHGALVYSRFGYGASDPVPLPRPLTYMHEEAREVLPLVLDAAGVGEVVLIGHSDGASIALMAATTDRRVRGLVLEAPHVFVEDISIASIEKAKTAYESGDLRARLAKYHAHVDVAFRGWNDAWLDPDFRSWNLEHYLPAITVPVLVIQGEDDPYGTRAQVDAIARATRDRVDTLMLPACGHAPHRDQPEATLQAIATFVERLAPQRAGRRTVS